MAHLVKKKIGNNEYLYIQKSYYNKGKRKTEHVAYLGRAYKYSASQLQAILNAADTKTKKQLNKIIKKHNTTHKI